MNLPTVKEIIIVEGRDDTAAIKRAVRAVTIETHGFGISKSTWEKIENAYRDYGIIVFTDPDHAGEEIRRKITEKFPEAKQAFLSREKASEKKVVQGEASGSGCEAGKVFVDIGIENATPEDIREALEKAHASSKEQDEAFSITDLDRAGLAGGPGSKERREKLGDILGIGYANAKGLLYKLNTLGIERESFNEVVKKL